MEDTNSALIERLTEEKLEGKSYSEIRKELQTAGKSEEEIKTMIRQIDARVLEAELRGSAPDRGRQLYFAGLALAIVGLALTLAPRAGMDLGGLPPYIAYIPFFLGIILMFAARRLRSGESSKKHEGTGAIRKKRPFK